MPQRPQEDQFRPLELSHKESNGTKAWDEFSGFIFAFNLTNLLLVISCKKKHIGVQEENLNKANIIYKRIIENLNMREADAYEALMQELLDQVQAEPETIIDFARLVFEQRPTGGTFFDATLSFLPMEDWPPLVYDATVILRSSKRTNSHSHEVPNGAAQSILEYASLQAPESLEPYKTQLADMAELYLAEFDDPPELYPARAWHIAFSGDYLKELLETRSQKAENRIHPTWIKTPTGASLLPFGGVSKATCEICAGGMGYIFWCDTCKVSTIGEQYT